jgi:photosystem II stability/assembly factor-like uncharacterized protein
MTMADESGIRAFGRRLCSSAHQLMVRSASASTLALVLILAGCGGGGGGDPLGPPVTVLQVASATVVSEDTRAFGVTFDGPAGTTIRWDFGDGTSTTGPAVQHTYTHAGDFDVVVTASTPAGASASAHASAAVRFASHVQGRVCEVGTGWCWQDEKVTARELTDVFFLDQQRGWAAGDGGTILRTQDGGFSWTRQATPTRRWIRSIRFEDALHGWALLALDLPYAANGFTAAPGPTALLQTDDGGATWRLNAASDGLVIPYDTTIVQVAAPWIVLSNGIASPDGGTTWNTPSSPTSPGTNFGGDCWSLQPADWPTHIVKMPGCHVPKLDVTPPLGNLGTQASFRFLVPAFSDAMHGIVLGQEDGGATLWATSDGGANWTRTSRPGESYGALDKLSLSDPAHAWAMRHLATDPAPANDIVRSTDGGITWPTVATPFGSAVDNVVAWTANTAWVASSGSFALTHDAGAHWRTLSVPEEGGGKYAVEVMRWSDDDLRVAVRYGGRIHVTADGGATWTRVVGGDPALAVAASAVSFADASHGLRLFGNGTLMRTINGGVDWTRSQLPVTAPAATGAPVALWLSSPSEGWMVRERRLWRTVDGGVSWTVAGPAADTWNMNWVDANHGWLIDTAGTIYRSTDAGAHWAALPAIKGYVCCGSLAFISPTIGVTSNVADGKLYRTTDGGDSWTQVAGTPGDAGPVVAAGGQLWMRSNFSLRSSDGGLTWTALPFYISDISFSDSRHGAAIADENQVVYTEDGGATWSAPQKLGSRMAFSAIWMADPYTGWLQSDDGQMLATASGGK